MQEKSRIKIHPLNFLLIVMIGKDKIITLAIDDNDIVTNADGELDCPLETTMRRNNITVEKIRQWEIETFQLIAMTNDDEEVLYEFDADIVIDLLIV